MIAAMNSNELYEFFKILKNTSPPLNQVPLWKNARHPAPLIQSPHFKVLNFSATEMKCNQVGLSKLFHWESWDLDKTWLMKNVLWNGSFTYLIFSMEWERVATLLTNVSLRHSMLSIIIKSEWFKLILI